MKIYQLVFFVFILFAFANCTTTGDTTTSTVSDETRQPVNPGRGTSVESVRQVVLFYAEDKTPGGKVLQAAVTMIDEKEIIVGSCWGYINGVYNKAGFTSDKRESVYRQPETGPFADPTAIRPGDWVAYKNLPYGEIGHSAIFVEWIDFQKRSALTIEYAGMDRREPGRYREADLTKIFGIVRGKE